MLDALELDHVDLIGNSLGGRIALEVALRQPKRVAVSCCSPRRWRGGAIAH
jgi:pimeloyl-ACP methyl ester carboxylesterase